MVLVKLLLLLQLLAKFPAELLSVSCFVILKPVEDVLAFNLAIEREVGSDLLNLRSIGSSHSSPIHFLQDHELLWGWTPPWWGCWRHDCYGYGVCLLQRRLGVGGGRGALQRDINRWQERKIQCQKERARQKGWRERAAKGEVKKEEKYPLQVVMLMFPWEGHSVKVSGKCRVRERESVEWVNESEEDLVGFAWMIPSSSPYY